MRFAMLAVGVALWAAPVHADTVESAAIAHTEDIPCGMCHDFDYSSDTGLYDPFVSHSFSGGGGVALNAPAARSGNQWKIVLSSWQRESPAQLSLDFAATFRSGFVLLDAPECPTSAGQTCQHRGSSNSECNSPGGHGCHDSFGAGGCYSSHYPCRYPPGGYPESAAAELEQGNSVARLAQSFRAVARVRAFEVVNDRLRFFQCDGMTELEVKVRPALASAIALVMRDGLVAAPLSSSL